MSFSFTRLIQFLLHHFWLAEIRVFEFNNPSALVLDFVNYKLSKINVLCLSRITVFYMFYCLECSVNWNVATYFMVVGILSEFLDCTQFVDFNSHSLAINYCTGAITSLPPLFVDFTTSQLVHMRSNAKFCSSPVVVFDNRVWLIVSTKCFASRFAKFLQALIWMGLQIRCRWLAFITNYHVMVSLIPLHGTTKAKFHHDIYHQLWNEHPNYVYGGTPYALRLALYFWMVLIL